MSHRSPTDTFTLSIEIKIAPKLILDLNHEANVMATTSSFEKEGIVQNRFEIIFELCFQHETILLGLTNRLMPEVFENSNKKLVKINHKVNEFRKMQF